MTYDVKTNIVVRSGRLDSVWISSSGVLGGSDTNSEGLKNVINLLLS